VGRNNTEKFLYLQEKRHLKTELDCTLTGKHNTEKVCTFTGRYNTHTKKTVLSQNNTKQCKCAASQNKTTQNMKLINNCTPSRRKLSVLFFATY
jgi:hypothetical protein